MSKKHFVVYTKPACPNCVSAKNFISLHGDTFDELTIGVDLSRDDFLESYPTVRTMPYIVYFDPMQEKDVGEHVGGFDSLKEFYRQQQYK